MFVEKRCFERLLFVMRLLTS